MKITRIGIVTLALLMLSSIALANVKGAAWPNLPSTMVQLTAVDGTTSYFMSTLSGVPAGFDVQNETYPGWCIDRSVTMIRGVSHDVVLYSSLSPPAALSGINWIAINYILNHKQGTMMDVQEAIWYFIDALSPISPTAQAMVDAANANLSYDPLTGDVLAVICLPQDDPGAQNSIIELKAPCLGTGRSPGYWKHNVKVYNGGPGHYSGDPHESDATMEQYEAEIQIDHPDFTLEWANEMFQDNAHKDMWLTIANWFNAAAGLQPYVESNAEEYIRTRTPGKF
jgi:hypothetical protein